MRAPAARVAANAGFELDGRAFCFAGANNYYLTYKPRPMVDDVLASARALGFPVLRIWAFIDVGARDGSVKTTDSAKEGVYFQYWDPAQKRPRYNDGESGLAHLDYVLAAAARHGVKLILVLTNNWREFGGIDQYVAWYGREAHAEFFTAPEMRAAYEDWLTHLVDRTNTVTGRAYRDDPTIFAWELANEPRCRGSVGMSGGCTQQTISTWADAMSSFIKSIDPNHLVSVGDEGFLDAHGEHFAYAAGDGVNHEALTALPNVDFGTFHLYPDDWGTSVAWGERWIADHERIAQRLGKPSILEEYGIKVARDASGAPRDGLDARLAAYGRWNDVVLSEGGSASLVWMLAGNAGASRYPDIDHYSVYPRDESTTLLATIAERFTSAAPACANAPQSERPPSPFVRVWRDARPIAEFWGGHLSL